MKHLLALAFLLTVSGRATADNSTLSYVCVSSTNSNSYALVIVTSSTLGLFVQNYHQTSPINLLASSGSLDSTTSSPTLFVFKSMLDANGKALSATEAASVEVSISNNQVSSIGLIRSDAHGKLEKLVYDQNCQIDN